jgi:hypothetical protein
MTRGKFSAVWFAIVGLFTGYGFFGPGFKNQIYGTPFSWELALEASISCAAFGICIATNLVVGLIVSIGVRVHGAVRDNATLILFLSAIVSTMLPTLILIGSGLFHGERAWTILLGTPLMAAISFLFFIAFTIFVFRVSRR